MRALADGQFLSPTPVHPAWGQVRTVILPNPPAGSDWKFSAPGGFLTRIVRATCLFTASAVEKERFLALQHTDGVSVLGLQLIVSAPVKALLRRINMVASHSPTLVKPGSEEVEIGIGNKLMRPGETLEAFTEPLDPGDQWSGITLQVEQFEVIQSHPLAELAAEVTEIIRLREAVSHAAS